MKSSMVKTTLREIWGSFGRYMAILAIVALGVGFFAGLMVTTPTMVKAGGSYMNDKELFDLRLLSTLGFGKDAETLFAGNDGVEAVEGAVSTDFLAKDPQGEIRVMTAQTLLSVQNQLEVKAGRLPEKPGECVVDAHAFGEDAIGSFLGIAKENEEETGELFAYRSYEIVGLVDAVYYANYERGSSALGNGKVSGFVYFLPQGFDTDYYTELFVRFGEDYALYSDAYKETVEDFKDWAKPLTEQAAMQRYDTILAEADEKIADAEAELLEKTGEARAELADAEKKIADGEASLADANEKIADGEAELADGQREVADGQRQLADNRAQLADARRQIEDGQAQLAQGRQQLETALAQAQAAYQAGQSDAQTQAQIGQLSLQLQQLEAQEAALQERLLQVAAGERQAQEAGRELAQAQREIEEGEAELEENRQKLADAQKDLEEGKREYEDGLQKLEEKTAEAEEKIADARQELADLKEPDVYVLGRDTNVGYACFENDSTIVAGIAKVFPLFFFLVAALVCITTMNRMVEEQRTQIGVLKALGYGEYRIMGKYLFYSGSAAVIGSVFGFSVGCILFPTVIWNAYKIMYSLGEAVLIFDPWLAIVSLLVSLLCSMGTTWLTCRYELASVAAQLLRPKSPKAGKRIWLEYFPFIWGRFSFLVKVSIRNVLRYKQRFFMMVVGIGGCSALLVTGFGIKDSIVDVAVQQYGEIQRYTLGVTLKDPIEGEESDATGIAMENGADGYVIVCEKAMDVNGPADTKSANIVIPKHPEQMRAYIDLHTQKKEPIDWPQKGEAVMNTKLAEKCGLKIGDTVSLRNEDNEKLTVKLAATSRNFVYNYVYVSPDTWEADNGDSPAYKSLYIDTQKDCDIGALSEKLLACEEVSAVSDSADFMDRVSNMMKSVDYIVVLIVFCAGALAFIVIYNLTNINITERIREIATIKVLGFYPAETASYVFRENIFLTAIGAAAGLLMGVFLHGFVISKIDVDMITFDVRILPLSYLWSILLTFVFMVIVDLFMYAKLERINMAESLKSIE